LRILAPFTMTERTAPTPFFATTNLTDPNHPAFTFTIVAYIKAPTLIHRETDPIEFFSQRKADDDAYRLLATPTFWNRFITLGYHATTGKEFETIWKNRLVDPLRFHRLVWYNYLYYVDRGFDIPTKLHFWATQVANPFLNEYSSDSVDMDTEKFSWQVLIAHLEKHSSLTKWLPVGKKNRPPRSQTPPPNNIDSQQRKLADKRVTTFNIPTDTVTTGNDIIEESNLDIPEPATPTTHSPNDNDVDMHSASDAKQSAVTMTNEIATNDGTNRLTFKWKVSKSEFSTLTQNRTQLLSEIHSILSIMFTTPDGFFYRWDSDDRTQAKTIQDLTIADVKHFLAPAITTLPSFNTIIFAVRFGFTEHPIAWKNSAEVQEAMRINTMTVSVSNSKSTSGKLTIAGYILLKHPSITHRHRYNQYLRQNLPENTPFFDVFAHRTTPADQKISHLVVQCGENHVTPLCQALSTLLTGRQTAGVFLPRYTFATMNPDEIKSHFIMHEKYINSLHQVSLAPLVTALDKIRVEYRSDGTTIERTTREWALSLTLPDGTSAQCDVGTGGSNKNAYLLIPAAYAAVIKPLAKAYKESIQTVSKREARYRENLPDLPDVIHITSTVQSNLDFMAQLSAADIWNNAPSSVKPSPYASAPNPGMETNDSSVTSTSGDSKSVTWPSLVKRPSSNTSFSSPATQRKSPPPTSLKKLKRHQGKSAQISVTSIDDDDRASTTSTHSLTNTIRSTPGTRLAELDAEMRECRETLHRTNAIAADTATRLSNTEHHLEITMETMTVLTRSVSGLQTQFDGFARTLEGLRLSMVHQAQHAPAAIVPYAGYPPQLSQHQLATIPEMHLPVTGLGIASHHLRSPEKKKKKRFYNKADMDSKTDNEDEEDDANNGASPMEAMDLFSDDDPQPAIGNHFSTASHPAQILNPNDNTQYSPSPPDVQYATQSVPAGQEDT
jgi:hypothetical protein